MTDSDQRLVQLCVWISLHPSAVVVADRSNDPTDYPFGSLTGQSWRFKPGTTGH